MTNAQIIANECIAHGIYSAAQIANMAVIPVHTYQYWKSIGYQVRKGEKAAIKTKLWEMVMTVEPEAEPEEEKAPAMRLVKAALFTLQQVDKIESAPEQKSAQKQTSSAPEKEQKKKSAQKKTSSAPKSARKTLTKQEAEDNRKKIESAPVKLVPKKQGTSSEAQLIHEKTGCTVTDSFAKDFAADIKNRYGKTLDEFFAA